MKLFMLKGAADSVSSITRDFIEIKKINQKLLILLYCFYFYCVWAFFGFSNFKLYLVSITNTTLNLSVVNKEVFILRVFSFDETVAFFVVKPFHGTVFHIAISEKYYV